jgi:hypothetical protein
MMKKLISAFVVLTYSTVALAHEGMWIPSVLGAVYDDMQGMGLKLSQEDLYSINHSSLKDAIVLFGGGCTAEVVSKNGLLFTNHHCGFDEIQYHSSLEHDYLKYGYWAKSYNDELACPDLKATFVVSMEEVTAAMNKGITDGMTAEEMDKIRLANRKALEEETKKKGITEFVIRAFNYGYQYFLIVTKTYRDVRFVGAPPSCVGKFGGDTDNWVWPRHTGDFSVFRIYANADNEPADYNKDNKPYTPAQHLKVSLAGAHEGDFSMIYGFPGRTDHWLTSYGVEYASNQSNPLRIGMRDATLDVINARMKTSDKVRIQYAAKQSSTANAWKKWMGQNMGLQKMGAVAEKQQFEIRFTQKAKDLGKYTNLIPDLKALYESKSPVLLARDGFTDYIYYGPEIFAFVHDISDLIANFEKLSTDGKLEARKKEIREKASLFYKNLDLTTEKEIFVRTTPVYVSGVREDLGPVAITKWKKKGWNELANAIYDKSVFADSTKFFAMLDHFSAKSGKKLSKEISLQISDELYKIYAEKIKGEYATYLSKLDNLMYQYVKAQVEFEMVPEYYCDANSTLRIGFGKVEGSKPRDGMMYTYYTTADGILEKNATGNVDFELLPDFKKKLEEKSYGNYAENGELRVCYTGSNHTTGGNSGSPALNAKGELVGINFDRSWESTMSDLYYSPVLCRNIMVDIRYVLWVIDEYAGADRLIEELTLTK